MDRDPPSPTTAPEPTPHSADEASHWGDGDHDTAPAGNSTAGHPMQSWRAFFRQFITLAGPYWNSREKWHAWGMTAALITLTAAQVGVPVALNLWNQRLFDALEQRMFGEFLTLIGVLAIIVVANVTIVTTHLRVKRRLQVSWRRWLTRRMINEWMASGRHYQVTQIPGEHDNPDGRIAEDIRITTEYAIDLAHSLLYSAMLLVSFTHILWTLSGPPEVHLNGHELYLPGHLVWVAMVYAALGTTVAVLLGRPLVRAVNRRQTAEADFRFGLVHARENSLAIALLRGEAGERRHFVELFRGAKGAWDRQTIALSNIFLFVSSWAVLSQVFPILIAAPRYIAGAISLGGLMQTAQAFQQMAAALSWPIDNLAKVAEWRASVERVQGLHEALDAVARKRGQASSEGEPPMIATARNDTPHLSFRSLAVNNPDGSPVLLPFDCDIRYGERVLITGDSGAAVKLFKVVAGLWPWGNGTVALPVDGTIFFMTQRPYLPLGSLRDTVCYPGLPTLVDDQQIQAILQRVGLGALGKRLDETENWEQVLASGEQQRLGFARLLLHRPQWIFIQEATDSLSQQSEIRMMELLLEEFPQATIITIGNHDGLKAFHQRHILLNRVNGFAVVEFQ